MPTSSAIKAHAKKLIASSHLFNYSVNSYIESHITNRLHTTTPEDSILHPIYGWVASTSHCTCIATWMLTSTYSWNIDLRNNWVLYECCPATWCWKCAPLMCKAPWMHVSITFLQLLSCARFQSLMNEILADLRVRWVPWPCLQQAIYVWWPYLLASLPKHAFSLRCKSDGKN